MKPTVADFMLERPELWGVRTIYGYPGASLTTALLKGDPDARGVVVQSLRELTAGLPPQRR